MADERAEIHKFDVEVDRRVTQKLSEAGINKPEDLGPGRADLGTTAQLLQNAGVDDELSPLAAEKVMRDAEFARQAGGVEQPPAAQSAEALPSDRLSQLQSQLQEATAAVDHWKSKYGQSENKVGDVRNRLRELERKVDGNGGQVGFTPAQPNTPFYGGPQFAATYGADANDQVTMGQLIGLMQAQNAALGQQLQISQQQVLQNAHDVARGLRGYNLTPAQEADILDNHPEILDLPVGKREGLMMAIAGNGQAAPTTQSAARTASQTAVEQARGQVRTFQYIEPTTGAQAAQQEQLAQSGPDIARQKISKDIRDALNKPGGAEEAERLMSKLGAGVVDDRDNIMPPRLTR